MKDEASVRDITEYFSKRQYTQATINQGFNDFLQLDEASDAILMRYHQELMLGGDQFVKVFYAYLMKSQATAQILKEYQKNGGLIDDLVKTQTQHLFSLVSGRVNNSSAERMAHIGSVHYRHGIEPVWIMGAYKLYLDHLQSRIRTSKIIKPEDQAHLENTVTKLLFRDMGLMLEGYWNASLQMLSKEKEKVSNLRDQMSSLLANIPQLLWSIDITQNQPLYVSPSALKICDMDIEIPIPCLGWTVEEDKPMVEQAWRAALQGCTIEVESRVLLPNGEQRWFRRIFYPFKNSSGEVVRIDGLMEDTTDHKITQERLNTLATTDSLTGLTNRMLFQERLTQTITSAQRNSQHQVVIMLMDLNHFKEVNDTLGHPSGDEVLVEVGKRLQAIVRQSDSLARLGGDEFAIFLSTDTNTRGSAILVAEKIQKAFVSPYQIDGNDIFLGISIGMAIYPKDGDDVATLMRRADVAMYSAKANDLAYRFYDDELDPNAQMNLLLSAELRHAIDRNELFLQYQPKINLVSNDGLIGVEALVRWNHPKRGLISPDEFIPLAERTGLIVPITDWVVKAALMQTKEWRLAGYDVTVAVNMSARCFHAASENVIKLNEVLEELDLPASCLEIEITENILMSDIANIFEILKSLSNIGVSIAIDDFGTGYSSLAYLKKLPLHTLKIDKSFVLDMANDENDAIIVKAIIKLAHSLGFKVVAEGVESAQALNMLVALGCDGAQGYHFSRPISGDDLPSWIKQQSLI